MSDAKRLPAPRGPALHFTFEGRPLTGYAGETLASALLAAGVGAFGLSREGQPRLPFCNMGTCFECSLLVAGQGQVRACLTDLQPGLIVSRYKAS